MHTSIAGELGNQIIASRFELLEAAGRGGMGTVYRAVDLQSGALVALKVMHETAGDSSSDVERFLREAQVLSQLSHPNIVRYVAHGMTTHTGVLRRPYLAMEWLSGESLAERLARRPLSEREALTLLRTVASALEVAHRSGVVHRDLKPSNLFLRNSLVEDVMLLDFGIARRKIHNEQITKTGTLIGTPDYMAPEQVRGERTVGPAADIFSLGCVFYECLTGSPPFSGQHIAATLAKILFGEPAPLRAVLPDIGAQTEALLEKMLRKSPAERLPDAGALLAEIDRASSTDPDAPLFLPGARSEQQIVSVVMALAASPSISDETLLASQALEALAGQQALVDSLRPFGQAEWLADGSLVLLVAAGGSATDQATQAARVALLLGRRWPGVRVAVATGRGGGDSKRMVGEALERVVRLLQTQPAPPPPGDAPRAAEESPEAFGVPVVDELTAGLLRGRFVLETRAGQAVLGGELASKGETRLLLGRPTSCVGREQELTTLELLLSECIGEGVQQVALVTAPPGVGKSRLRREFMSRAAALHPELRLLLGEADPLSAQAPYALLGQVVRRAAGILDGDPVSVQRARLHALLHDDVPEAERTEVLAFLGELARVPSDDIVFLPLRAARQDPELYRERMTSAFVEWLRGLTARGAVLLLLEDLHWSDPQSVALLYAVLRALPDVSLFVLTLARPAAVSLFPTLSEMCSQRIELHGLSKRASVQLVQQVLGPDADEATIARVIDQAQGNALFLEELIRAVAEGKGDHLPETVMAMLQVRITGLEPAARQALRAASIFGETSWRGGIAALLGKPPESIGDVLQGLISSEMLERRRDSRHPGETEYTFRHALLCDAAYGLLTEEERTLGHKRAGDYLERAGESEPLVLANHFDRGAEPARAGAYYLRAAETAHRNGERQGTLTAARRALACGIQAEQQITLLGLLCEAHAWYAEWEVARGYAETVMRLAPPSSSPWARAAVAIFGHTLDPARLDDFRDAYGTLAAYPPKEDALAEAGFVLMAALYILDTGGAFDRAADSLRLLSELTAQHPSHLGLYAWHWFTRAVHAVWQAGEPARALHHAELSRDAFRQVGFRRGALLAQVIMGLGGWLSGAHEAAERELRETLIGAPDLGPLTSLRSLVLCQLLTARGAFAEAEALALSMCEAGRRQRLPSDEGRGLWALAENHARRGDTEAAAQAVQAALPLLARLPPEQMAAQALWASILLKQGRTPAAAEVARQAVARYEALPGAGILRARAAQILADTHR